MPEWKYVRIHSDDPGVVLPDENNVPPFDLARLNGGFVSRSLSAAFRAILWPVLWLLQRIWPVARLGGLTIVTRADDVRTVLNNTSDFIMPFGPEMKALAGGETFVLGLDGPAHARQNKLIRDLIVPERDLPLIERLSREYTDALLDAGKGEIDAQRDCITRVAAETCARYFGFAIKDADQFAQWTIAASNFLFADPTGAPVAAELAAKAGARLRSLADRALSAAAEADDLPDTLAGRLVAMEQRTDGPSRGESRAILIGLAVGFVPTNSLAGGKMLELLARNRMAREAAIAAAISDDSETMKRILLEAGRLNPALAPGQWRWCPRDAEIARNDGGSVSIKGGSVVLVSTMAALRDPRDWENPGRFDADRAEPPDMLFGHLAHSCLGRELALAQLVPTMGAMLRRGGIAQSLAKLRIEWVGAYPQNARIRYYDKARDDRSGGVNQNGVLYAIPLPDVSDAAMVNAQIADIMATGENRAALDATNIVHFLSLTAADIPRDRNSGGVTCLLEINCDGPADEGASVAIAAIERPLKQIFAAIGHPVNGDIALWLAPHRIAMHGKPWGATALNFHGLPGLSVQDIATEARLADYVREAIDLYQRRELGRDSRPAALLGHVRRLIRQDATIITDDEWRDIAKKGRAFEPCLLKPADGEPMLAKWDENERSSLWQIITQSGLFRLLALGMIAVGIIVAVLLFVLIEPGGGTGTNGWLSLPWLVLQGLVSAIVLGLALALGALFLLRYKEERDLVDSERPTLEHLRALAAGENLPNHVKNHITVVTPLKGGLLRRLTLAFGLWGIGQSVTRYFRPGFVLDMGTIQFARWVRLPKTRAMIFQSNYDGSWESYLEDFITRAHLGQTAAWSNCEGFPKSRYLMLDGAKNGDPFKNYVRCKQTPTAFWYARFPDITAAQIRRNTMIRDGLARASSDGQARAWLSLFGSAPRTDREVDGEEVQAIVFNGFGKLPQASYLMLRLPSDAREAQRWLRALTGYRVEKTTAHLKSAGLNTIAGYEDLPDPMRVAFGEDDPERGAVSIAFTAAGLARLAGDNHPLLENMPGPFAMGMSERSERLGDDPACDLRWTDAETAGGVHVMLGIYSPNEKQHRRAMHNQRRLAGAFGLKEVDCQTACPLKQDGFPQDHFGFRDGVVQPIIAGSLKTARTRNSDDTVATGEMIIGYRNAQGYFPPPIAVPAHDDPLDLLPDISDDVSRYPRFGRSLRAGSDCRDFGRNGSFIAVRVLEQHVDRFAETCIRIAKDTNEHYQHLQSAVAAQIDCDWVAAKMVGRWPNGSSLIRSPAKAGTFDEADYTLAFGRDDPRGLRCPLGSHVRRANPRDSLLPGDPHEIDIVNRHRLMRRGRSYDRDGEKGLFFIAICQDLERQFEFVQRSWLKAGNFHTLEKEADPLIAASEKADGRFTVPTAGGSIRFDGLPSFTTLRAGGYFFLPSRSALKYLSSIRSP